jgi:hypothetical protein
VPQVLDDLEHRLEQYEAQLREVRRLLAQQKHRRNSAPEEIPSPRIAGNSSSECTV